MSRATVARDIRPSPAARHPATRHAAPSRPSEVSPREPLLWAPLPQKPHSGAARPTRPRQVRAMTATRHPRRRCADAACDEVHTRAMPLDLPCDQNGFHLARDARAVGRESAFYEAIRSGELERVRRGVYVRSERLHQPGSPAERDARRYLALVRASAYALERPVYTSYSAAALMGLPIVGRWPDSVYVMSRDGHGSRRRGVVSVARTTSPSSCGRGSSARHPSSSRSCSSAVMPHSRRRWWRRMPRCVCRALCPGRRPGPRRRSSPPSANGSLRSRGAGGPMPCCGEPVTGADTPIETVSRLVIEELGFAPPTLQHQLWLDELGRTAYLDFHWPGVEVAGEADGRGKYRGDRGDASSEPSSPRKSARMRSGPACAGSCAGTGRTCGNGSRSEPSSCGPACRSGAAEHIS